LFPRRERRLSHPAPESDDDHALERFFVRVITIRFVDERRSRSECSEQMVATVLVTPIHRLIAGSWKPSRGPASGRDLKRVGGTPA
jgi:hypothetical protein